jgi:hypothetical protein
MKNYDSEVLYEMYKKKCDENELLEHDLKNLACFRKMYLKEKKKLEEAIVIIKDLGECGISGRRERDFLKSVGIETEPKEVKFPIPRDDVKSQKKVTLSEAQFDEYVGNTVACYPSEIKALKNLRERIFG